MMMPRVPADKLEEARALTSPLSPSPDIVEKGKAIYEDKGGCVNCHGGSGRGDGPGAATLKPPPRVFRSHGFWRHRSEGEIFWVIKYGSPGTGMIPFGGMLSDEEIWTVMQYERSFAAGNGGGGSHEGMAGKKRKGRHGGGQGHSSSANVQQQSSAQELQQKGKRAAAATINISQAITLAIQRVPGTVLEAEFEEEDGKGLWEIQIVTQDSQVMEIKVDSESGDVMSAEEKKADKKKKQKRKRKGRKGEHGDDHECCSKEEHGGGHE
jgi:mono/diheme cytochrome c family protein